MFFMQEFISKKGKTLEDYNKFFHKLFIKIYDEAWNFGTKG